MYMSCSLVQGKGIRRKAYMELPIELVQHILLGRVGVSTYAVARQVNKTWAHACKDEELLKAIFHYANGLTRTQFRGLLRLTVKQAMWIPNRHCPRRQGGYMIIYRPDDCLEGLREYGGFAAIRERSPIPPWRQAIREDPNAYGKKGDERKRGTESEPWQHEERLHHRKLLREALEHVRHLPVDSVCVSTRGEKR